MREIKFRGKRKDNGEWVYGSYVKRLLPEDHFIIPDNRSFLPFNGRSITVGEFYEFQVDPESVGQYIDLKDINKEEICTGDIMKTPHGIRIVKYGAPNFYLYKKLDDDIDVDSFSTPGVYEEIIGNISDNPELLEQK